MKEQKNKKILEKEKQNLKSKQQPKGITLIALVVTIVVLLILAGVTITVLFGNSGIIKTAQEAADETNQAIKDDEEQMAELDSWIQEKGWGNTTGGATGDNPGGGNTTGGGTGDNPGGGNTTGGGDTPDTPEPPADVLVESITLNQTTATLEAGDKVTLEATVLPENATNKNVTWASEDNGIATVTQSGEITAVAVGETNITVTSDDAAKKSVSCHVTVTEPTTGPNGKPLVGIVAKDDTQNQEVEDKNGKILTIPAGFTVLKNGQNDVVYASGEPTVDDGIVVQDSKGNQFVWVPVTAGKPMFATNSGKAVGQLYNFTSAGSTTYSSSNYHEPDTVIGSDGSQYDAVAKNYSNAGITNEYEASKPIIKSATEFKALLQKEFDDMKKSVEHYGGFYIGRYETGDLSKTQVVVKKNNRDINRQNWYAMYQKSKSLTSGNVTSHMIWGCQWDATMNWLQSLGGIKASYVTDSTNKGNYLGTNGNVAIATGSNNSYRVNNIYDMAGNVYEWTLEAVGTRLRAIRRR